MSTFFSRLQDRILAVQSLLCVGLDPHPQDLPSPTPELAGEFCLRLIRSTSEHAACYKPNAAFFEAFGAAGVDMLAKIIAAVPEGIPVILDAKRGDIASTAGAYAQAVFHTLGADAVTLNPYLGYDSVTPFLGDPEKGVFLLCKTSNPGSADLQNLRVIAEGDQELMVYEHVARLAQQWNRNDNLGIVVGATHPEALSRVRALAPKLWILAPGVGTQGGDLDIALRAGLRQDGLGLLIPVSRSLARAADPGRSAADLRVAINRVRAQVDAGDPTLDARFPTNLARLADGLLDAGCIKFGEFTLKSGIVSPIYIDLRHLVSYPDLLSQVASAYLPLLKSLSFDRLAALPYAAIPIATAISLQGGWPLIYPRKEVKSYGTKAEIEGEYRPGDQVVVIDDLVTTGGSKFEVIEKMTRAGLYVEDVLVLVDRQSGADLALSQAGYRLHSVFTLSDLLGYWQNAGKISSVQASEVRSFLKMQNV